jgi:hypothetical protein
MSPAAPVPRGARTALAAAGAFAAVVALAWVVLAHLQLPDPGGWTGIRPLERKLDLLDVYAHGGPVDALVMGSSIVDAGFSAALYSRLMSRHLGRDYRAFNFAIGGAEPRTLPRLYRLARLVARPRSVLVVAPPEPRLRDEITPVSPDAALLAAPVGPLLERDLLLRASRLVWSTPIARSAPALREMLLTGHVDSLARALGSDAFPVDAHGDRVSYAVIASTENLRLYRAELQAAVAPYPRFGPAAPGLRSMLDFYFSPLDAAALEELARLVHADGGELHLLAHAGAASLWTGPVGNPAFDRGRADFFAAFAAALGADFHDPVPSAALPLAALADDVHLNSYGAEIYTRAAFAAVTGEPAGGAGPLDAATEGPAGSGRDAAGGGGFGPDRFLVCRRAGETAALLHLRVVSSLAVPPLPADGLSVAVHTPDGRERLLPARALGSGDIVARMDLAPSPRPQALVVQVLHDESGRPVPVRNPLAAYEWLASSPRAMPAPAPDPLRRAAAWSARLFIGTAASDALLHRMDTGSTMPANIP